MKNKRLYETYTKHIRRINETYTNFCDKQEQLSLLKLPSAAKITTEGSNVYTKHKHILKVS